MAEAPEGPPRKTTTYNRFSTMASQNERYNTKDDEFFWLENIMRVAPHKLHSVPGPGAPSRFPLTSICSDATERGQQVLTIEKAFDQLLLTGLFNARTSWSHVENGQIYTMIGNADCGGGNMNYFNFGPPPGPGSYPICTVQYRFDNDSGATPPDAVGDPVAQQNFSGVNTHLGTSDVPAYKFGNGAGQWIAYVNENIKVNYQIPVDHLLGVNAPSWTVHDDRMYLMDQQSGTNKWRLCEYDRLGGGFPLATYFLWGTDSLTTNNLVATSDMVILFVANATQGTTTITKIDRAMGTISEELPIDGLSAAYMFAESDTLQYFLCLAPDGAHSPLYYYAGSNLVYVGHAAGAVASPFSASGYFNDGKFYFGGNGFSGLSVDIQKIAVDCPPIGGPIVATVSTGSSVAAGGSIDVTFGTILEPSITDRIQLKAAPAAGTLGFAGPTGTFISTGSATHGTLSFTIPGGTTPGSYVFQLCTFNGSMFIANSNTFTVT